MNKITTIHEKVLDHFIRKRKEDPTFYFVPRKINNKGRLDDGYWFIGNEYYLHISFWNGGDWKEKIHNIGFVIFNDKTCKIELSAQDSDEKADFFEKVVNKLNGYYKDGSKNKWYKDLDGKNYLDLIDQFIKTDKSVIDKLLIREQPDGILALDNQFYNRYIQPIIERRLEQIEFGKINKITRITWNTEKWQRPSGSSGKSSYHGAYEANWGFGHEEWLLDKTTILDGYHYAFLQSLNIETDRHVGQVYNITLFTTNNLGKKYEVGIIKNVECISSGESDRVYGIYHNKDWIKKMETDLLKVNADITKFRETTRQEFFNIKFQFKDAHIHEELVEIAADDVNITTNHFKLLPKKTEEVNADLIDIDVAADPNEHDEAGNRKNTAKRRKVFNIECEYDPYHDMMQNFLFDMLTAGHEGYQDAKIEKGRVDVKAKAPDGKWHYFEIKTDGPKLSIRKALGQIMEYAYYPSLERAAKLIVIADEEPDEDAIEYLHYIRQKFKMPVFYRALDIELGTLSIEF